MSIFLLLPELFRRFYAGTGGTRFRPPWRLAAVGAGVGGKAYWCPADAD